MSDDYFTDEIATEIYIGIFLCIVIWIVVYIVKTTYAKIQNSSSDTPMVIYGLKPANNPRSIPQNPNEIGSKTLKRSQNEVGGIEYTYVIWMYIDGNTWKTDKTTWKHVFHKGPSSLKNINKTSLPSKRCPIQASGLWIHPSENVLRLYVNTFESNEEFVDIENIPVKKWFCLVYSQTNFNSDIFINGRLKKRMQLRSLPRQNYAKLLVNQDDGFEGFISDLRYYNRAIKPTEIFDLALRGPNLYVSKDPMLGNNQNNSANPYVDVSLPYLSDRWWEDDKTLTTE
jgi:hypothetical protein